MKSILYKKWDGSQEPFSLKKKDIVDRFMENIMKGMSPNMSMAQMLWEGFPLAGMDFRVMGLEEMFHELQKQKKDLFSTYHLENAFDQPMDDLKRLLDQEAATRQEQGARRPPSHDSLAPGILEKLILIPEGACFGSTPGCFVSGVKVENNIFFLPVVT